jgi:DNA-directed RNA polymerase subunit M/transcription elongation factor TFIIS
MPTHITAATAPRLFINAPLDLCDTQNNHLNEATDAHAIQFTLDEASVMEEEEKNREVTILKSRTTVLSRQRTQEHTSKAHQGTTIDVTEHNAGISRDEHIAMTVAKPTTQVNHADNVNTKPTLRHTCEHCDRRFLFYSQLMAHSRVHNTAHSSKYTCKECLTRFARRHQLTVHARQTGHDIDA